MNDPATALAIGLHYDIPIDRYIADPCERPSISAGIMHDIIYRTPRHAWWNNRRLNPYAPIEESYRADIGSGIHAAILGGKPIVYGAFDDWRTKAAREWRDAVRAEGGIPLLEKDLNTVSGAKLSASFFLDYLPGGPYEWRTEGTMIWEMDGVMKRGRFDLWSEKANKMIDVKTCASANPGAWIKTTLTSAGYDIQAEHYLEGIRALADPRPGTEFLFLLVEIEPPFCCSLVGMDPAMSDFVQRKIKFATCIFKDCLGKKFWPGYSLAPHWAELKPWDEADLELRMLYSKEVNP